MGDPDALGLPGSRPDQDNLLPLRREAVERYRADDAPEQPVANLLDRFREALPRNPYLEALLAFAEQLHRRTWLARHEALCVLGGWFHDDVARDRSGSPRAEIKDVFRVVSTQLAGFAAKRPLLPLSALMAGARPKSEGESAPRPARGAFHDLLGPDPEPDRR